MTEPLVRNRSTLSPNCSGRAEELVALAADKPRADNVFWIDVYPGLTLKMIEFMIQALTICVKAQCVAW